MLPKLAIGPASQNSVFSRMTMTDSNAPAFHLPDVIALLRRTPASLDALLRGLPALWVRGTEGPDTWSAYDIVGHLIYTEHASWIPRIRHILDHGESVPLPPFDRAGHFARNRGQSLDQLLDEFAQARAESLTALEALGLTPAQFERRGLHPRLGSITLGSVVATWPVHDLNHLHQLSRVMARQYAAPVGPWASFVGALQCDAHGA